MNKEGDLAIELATMHGTLFNLIVELRNTELSRGQPAMVYFLISHIQKQ
jgi:hypothetical protein